MALLSRRVCEAKLSYSDGAGAGARRTSRGCGACEDGLGNDGTRNVSAARKARRDETSGKAEIDFDFEVEGEGEGVGVSPDSIKLGLYNRQGRGRGLRFGRNETAHMQDLAKRTGWMGESARAMVCSQSDGRWEMVDLRQASSVLIRGRLDSLRYSQGKLMLLRLSVGSPVRVLLGIGLGGARFTSLLLSSSFNFTLQTRLVSSRWRRGYLLFTETYTCYACSTNCRGFRTPDASESPYPTPEQE